MRADDRASVEQAAGRPGGARSLKEWCLCLAVLRGDSAECDLETARGTVRNTPAARRHEFAMEIARRRRERGTDRRPVIL